MARKQTNSPFTNNSKTYPCGVGDCRYDAIARIRVKTGLLAVCGHHYQEHYTQEAYRGLDKWGMERLPDESREEWTLRMRQFVRKGVKKLSGAIAGYK